MQQFNALDVNFFISHSPYQCIFEIMNDKNTWSIRSMAAQIAALSFDMAILGIEIRP